MNLMSDTEPIVGHRNSNVGHRLSNVGHRQSNVGHKEPNVGHREPNDGHRTLCRSQNLMSVTERNVGHRT